MAEVFGIEMPDLPAGYIPIETVLIVKAMDDHQDLVLLIRQSSGLTTWESLGMATCAAGSLRDDLRSGYRPSEDDE